MRFVYLSIFLIILSCSKQPTAQSPDEPQRYIVYTNPGENVSQLEGRLNSHGIHIYRALYARPGFVVYMQPNRAQFSTFSVERDIIHKAIGSCQRPPLPPPGPGLPPPPPVQPGQQIPWGVAMVKAPEAWRFTRGEGMVVCVADTGVDKTHPDLSIFGGADFTGKGDFQDGNGHGTHVAGTIAAVDNSIGVVGVAPKAQIFAAKVLDDSGSGFSSDIADGIIACVNSGAHVINLSLGASEPSNLIRSALISAANAGLTSVCAAGNDSGPTNYPAAFPECLSVTAMTQSLRLASFSSFGPETSFIAPGVGIESTFPIHSYSTLSGTSMAAPHVAGVEALRRASGRGTIKTVPLGLGVQLEGAGLVNAEATVQ